MIRITGLGEPSRGRCDIVAYHTHLLNTATKAEAEAGIRDDIAGLFARGHAANYAHRDLYRRHTATCTDRGQAVVA
jgi:hypothetical protein